MNIASQTANLHHRQESQQRKGTDVSP